MVVFEGRRPERMSDHVRVESVDAGEWRRLYASESKRRAAHVGAGAPPHPSYILLYMASHWLSVSTTIHANIGTASYATSDAASTRDTFWDPLDIPEINKPPLEVAPTTVARVTRRTTEVVTRCMYPQLKRNIFSSCDREL